MLQGGAEASAMEPTGAAQNLSQALPLFFHSTNKWPPRVGASLFCPSSSASHPRRCPLIPSERLRHPCRRGGGGGGQGECGVFAGSKIYEQLKSRATPGIHQPGQTAASLGGWGWVGRWGGGMVKHRRYTFISVFSSKREGDGKMMFHHCGVSGLS